MIGDEFPVVLAAAQDGSEAAFARLWRDGNPALLRTLDQHRRRSRHPEAPYAELPPGAEPAAADTAAVAIGNLAVAELIQAVRELPAQQAEIIVLRMVADLDNQTVARIVGRSPGAVRTAAHRGLRRLAQNLAARDVTRLLVAAFQRTPCRSY